MGYSERRLSINILKKLFPQHHNENKNSIRKKIDHDDKEPPKAENKFQILNQRQIDELQSEQKENREATIKELEAIGEPIVDDLITALEEWYIWAKSDAHSIIFRISVARVLGLLGDTRAIDPLINMAARIETTLEHREVAAESLAMIGRPAFQPMLELLESKEASAQQLSAWTLGKMGDPIAIETLIPLLSKQPFHYPHVRAAANKALKELTGQNFGENIELWKKWMDDHPSD